MIKKSVLAFLFFFIVLSVFLFFNKSAFNSTQYQYQGNIIKAQKYLYSDSLPAITMVGTSMSANLLMDSLPGIYNLSMAGLSVFDGLNIACAKKRLSKVIMIEANYCFKPESSAFSSSFNFKPFNFIKTNFVALRDENQPIGITLHYIRSISGKRATTQLTEDTIPPLLFAEMINDNVKKQSNVDSDFINRSLDVLYKKVQEITDRGSTVCFFEMPVNEALQHLPLSNAVQTAIVRHFKTNPHVVFIAADTNYIYRTKDGVHLNNRELFIYTSYLRHALHSLSILPYGA